MATLPAGSLANLRPVLAAEATPVRVVVTTKPIHSLVSQVMEGIATPQLIVEGAASAHTFSLKPSAVRAIANAGLFVRVSNVAEPFTAKLVEDLPADVTVLTLADEKLGVALLPQRRAGSFQGHAHADGTPEPGHAQLADAGDPYPDWMIDGHIWLDPENAKAIVRAVAAALSQKWPHEAAAFAANADKATARLDALQAETGRDLAGVKGKPFVVFHDAYQYFEHRFAIPAAGAITLSPDQPPSAKRLSDVRETIRALHAACIFAEPGFQPNLLAAVSEGSAARTASLDPEGQSLAPGPNLYEQLIRGLAGNLKSCLSGV